MGWIVPISLLEVPDGSLYLCGHDKAVTVDVQQCHRKALGLQRFERMQHRMVLKGGGDDVHFALLPSQRRGGADRLVVRLAPAGGEIDLLRLRADDGGDLRTGLFQHVLCVLPVAVKAGGIPPGFAQNGRHGMDRRLTHFRRGGVVGIDHCEILLFQVSSAL